MILHACNVLGKSVDYMVGAQLEGYDCMVKITEENDVMILEGDEYLSSPIDRRPKFHLYKPNVALISGIAWDHINVFPTFSNYVEQFSIFVSLIEEGGKLVYNEEDPEVKKVAQMASSSVNCQSYQTPKYEVKNEGTLLTHNGNAYALKIFGHHNLQNLMGAMYVCEAIGINNHDFLTASASFTGAGKRLEKVVESKDFVMYKDFAHSPSKLKATTSAVKEQYPDREVVACMELHTFSSLKKEFLPQYNNAMNTADHALVYFHPEVVKHKKLEPISVDDVSQGFGGGVQVSNTTEDVLNFIRSFDWKNKVLLMMSSGNFDGINYDKLGEELAH
jgi:UDP-N-acetylmuramate: L-alanyl-gamma-D-glutamyl-meso-diaminopimelate ligase